MVPNKLNRQLLKIIMDLSSSRNRTSWHWSKICKKKPNNWWFCDTWQKCTLSSCIISNYTNGIGSTPLKTSSRSRGCGLPSTADSFRWTASSVSVTV